MNQEYQFIPLYKWNNESTFPKLSDYKRINPNISDFAIKNGAPSMHNMADPTTFAITNDKSRIFAYGSTFQFRNSMTKGGLFEDVIYDEYRGDNGHAEHEINIYRNGWVIYNMLGSGVPIMKSYLGRFKKM